MLLCQAHVRALHSVPACLLLLLRPAHLRRVICFRRHRRHLHQLRSTHFAAHPGTHFVRLLVRDRLAFLPEPLSHLASAFQAHQPTSSRRRHLDQEDPDPLPHPPHPALARPRPR